MDNTGQRILDYIYKGDLDQSVKFLLSNRFFKLEKKLFK